VQKPRDVGLDRIDYAHAHLGTRTSATLQHNALVRISTTVSNEFVLDSERPNPLVDRCNGLVSAFVSTTPLGHVLGLALCSDTHSQSLRGQLRDIDGSKVKVYHKSRADSIQLAWGSQKEIRIVSFSTMSSSTNIISLDFQHSVCGRATHRSKELFAAARIALRRAPPTIHALSLMLNQATLQVDSFAKA
jgi:hypothetical protein